MRRLLLAFAALPLAATPALAGMATVAPEKFGEIFCIARTGNDDGILRGVLSDELRTLIDYSEARNDTIAKANPDEKPPLGDGIPWSSFPDYAAECSVGSVAVEGKSARVVVDYGFPGEPSADYSDTLHLRLVAHPYDPDTGIWRLDDIRYTTSETLRETLTSAFDNQ
jgi:hypothetical protein